MEKQVETKLNYQDNHWLNTAEIVAVAGSIGGSVAAIFVKEILVASVPLSACVAINLINRKRLLKLITTENNQVIVELTQHNQNDHSNLADQMMQIQQSASKRQAQHETEYQNVSQQLSQIKADASQDVEKLQSQHEELTSKVRNLAQNTNSSSAEFYYENAHACQEAGEKQKAVKGYTKAIKLDHEYAEAYVNRGILSADIGNKKLAVEDLRKATKLYFDRGDLENYQKTKQKTQEIYQLNSNFKEEPKAQDENRVLASGLFS